MMNASTIGLSDLGTLVGVGVEGVDGVDVASNGIRFVVRLVPSFVT